MKAQELHLVWSNGVRRTPLSLGGAMSSQASQGEEFEEGLEGASLTGLLSSRKLGEEHERLRRFYGGAQRIA